MRSTKGEIFSKYCNITKTYGGSINPPSPLYQGGGVTSLVRPRVRKTFDNNVIVVDSYSS